MNELVTVIIPTYKRAKYLQRAINSVLTQSYSNIELIVVDDNDPNSDFRKDTENVINKYEKEKILYIKHEKNKNGAAARNTGIRNASGKYITFLDDDDFFFKDRIKYLVEDLEANKDYACVYSSCVFFENNKIKKIIYANKNGNMQIETLKQKTYFGTGSNMFFRKSVFKDIGEFDESFQRHQDLEIMVRFFNKFKILNDKRILVAKCEEDKGNFPNITKAIIYKEKFLERFKNEINKYSNPVQAEIYHDNILNLYINNVRLHDEKKEKKRLIQLKKMYKVQFNIKDIIKIIFERINKFIHIAEIYRMIRRRKYSKIDMKKCVNEYLWINKFERQ